MKTWSETLVMGLAVILCKVFLAHKDIPLLLNLQHQSCIAAIALICKLLSREREDSREMFCFLTQFQLILIYSMSGKGTLPFFHSQFQAKFVPLTKTIFKAIIKQEESK